MRYVVVDLRVDGNAHGGMLGDFEVAQRLELRKESRAHQITKVLQKLHHLKQK